MFTSKAKFEGHKSLKTKTNIIFSTKDELDEIALAQLIGSTGNLAFSHDEIKKEVEEAMKNRKIGITEDGRTRSQILRGAIFSWGLATNVPDGEAFYNEIMDKIIEYIKAKYR